MLHVLPHDHRLEAGVLQRLVPCAPKVVSREVALTKRRCWSTSVPFGRRPAHRVLSQAALIYSRGSLGPPWNRVISLLRACCSCWRSRSPLLVLRKPTPTRPLHLSPFYIGQVARSRAGQGAQRPQEGPRGRWLAHRLAASGCAGRARDLIERELLPQAAPGTPASTPPIATHGPWVNINARGQCDYNAITTRAHTSPALRRTLNCGGAR